MKKALFTIFIILSTLLTIKAQMTIEIRNFNLNKNYQSEYVLTGQLAIYNGTTQNILIPKSFDLEIVLKDTVGNMLIRNPNISCEYHNLIILEKPMQIPPSQIIYIDFLEWRLFLFQLKVGGKYSLQYILNTQYIKELHDQFECQRISSNIIDFKNDINSDY